MSEKLWYVGINGQQEGPIAEERVIEGIRRGKYTEAAFVFGPGVANWSPIKTTPPFASHFGAASLPIPVAMPGRGKADVIDYQTFGEDIQFVEITLDPGEGCVAEAGGMMFMEPGIEMETVFGDGSHSSSGGGFLEKIFAAGKRLLTGESLFMTVFLNRSEVRRNVSFAAPYPGTIVPIDLAAHNGTILCQKDAFLCAAKGISIGMEFQRKLGVGLFGGEGFILQKLEGDGLAFVHAGGVLVSRKLSAGETLRVDTGCVVAFERTVNYDIQMATGIKSAIFGGEGLFLATLSGPGTVWLQSLPLSRLAGRIISAATPGRSRDEGSVIGNIFMGDRS